MRVIVLSKAPVAGKVKTRLMPEYTAEQAAALHKQMTEIVVSKVCSTFDDVWLAVDDIKHHFFKRLQQEHACHLQYQGLGDLGQRLQSLATASFKDKSKSIMFLGTDSPHVNIGRYQQAAAALNNYDVVIGPVEDGGYDLIAMANYSPGIFDDIDWGLSTVFDKTITNIKQLGLSVKVLDMSFDLDYAEDLKRAPANTW
jgi:rSAM/selenodomain-associated transferase 1